MIQDLRAIIIFYAGNGWIPCMLCSEDRWLSYLVGTISESAPNIVFLLQNNRLEGIVLVRSFKQGFASDQSRGSCAYYDNSHYQDEIQLDLSKVKGGVQGWVEVVLTVTRFRYACVDLLLHGLKICRLWLIVIRVPLIWNFQNSTAVVYR